MTSIKENRDFSEKVYNVDSKKNENKRLSDGKLFKSNGVKYVVIKTKDNQNNGFQGMAVSPLDRNGKPDYTHITISFAGTNFSDGNDVAEDVQGIGEGNRNTIEGNSLGYGGKINVGSQFESALNFYRKIHKKYPNAKINVTGHSLGGAIALLVASHFHISAKVFSAPDPWKAMNDKERLWALANPELLINFRHHGDFYSERDSQGLRIDGFTGTTVWCETTAKGFGKGHNTHMLATFEFKDGGQIKVLNKKMGSDAYLMKEKLYAIEAMAQSFKKSGGKFTHAEKIALDAVEAISMSDSLSRIAEDGIDQIIKHYKNGIDSFEENWLNTVKAAEGIGEHLTQDEIMNALEQSGVTYKTMVQNPTSEFEEKIHYAKQIKEDYLNLSNKIKRTVDEVIKTDKELAEIF